MVAPAFSSDEDDSDVNLEVLPPASKSVPSTGNNNDGKPRLSFTGNSEKDPVSLLELDDERGDPSSDESSVQIFVTHECATVKKETTEIPQNAVKKKLAERKKTPLIGSTKTSKPTRAPAATSAFSSSSSSDDDSLANIRQTLKASAPRKPTTGFSSSSDDDSFADVRKKLQAAAPRPVKATQRKSPSPTNKKRSRPTAAAAKRQAREEERAAQRQAREQQRAIQRQAKQAQQRATQQARERQKQACQQASGKLAHTEIAVLWDIPHRQWDSSEDDGTSFRIVTHSSSTSALARTVQWIRLDSLQGGAEEAVVALKNARTGGFEHIPVVAIVASGETFLDLLRHDGEDDYPRLEAWITAFQEQWKKTWKTDKEPRIILLLDRVQEELENRWKRSKSKHDLATMEELHDAITWLLIQFRVESIRCRSEDELLYHLKKMTRLLAEAPYVQETTEIQCVKKLPSEIDADQCTEEERAHDCWLRQVQQIPNISNQKALAFVQYYPTSVSLWRDYMNPDVEESSKRLLVANMFTDKRQFRKLANQMYTVMTTQDPNEVV